MDQPPLPTPRLLLYAQASPAQLAQALVAAKEALGPYYPTLTWPQWHQAFEQLQPILQVGTDQVSLTTEGLTKLAQYFENQFTKSTPSTTQLPLPAPPPSSITPAPTPLTASSSATATWPKRTYNLRPEVIELIDRVSYWRRDGKSDLVNQAVTELLADYAEAQRPIPPKVRRPRKGPAARPTP